MTERDVMPQTVVEGHRGRTFLTKCDLHRLADVTHQPHILSVCLHLLYVGQPCPWSRAWDMLQEIEKIILFFSLGKYSPTYQHG